MTKSEMVKAILKVQILSSKPSDSMGKDISLQKDEILVDLKSTETPVKRKLKKDFITVLETTAKIKNREKQWS